MTLHIIHLPERTDRYEQLKRELSIQRIQDYRIWPGIRDAHSPATGISKAHKQIVRHGLENKLPKLLIAEDDVKFTAPGAMEYFLKQEPSIYDLYLGGITYGEINDDHETKDFAGTHFYMIKEEFYETFLAVPETGHLDRNLKGLGKYIICDPFVAIQFNGFSDQKGEEVNFDYYFKDRKLYTGAIY